MKLTKAEIDAMPLDEKFELAEALWQSIYESADGLPVPDWHMQLLQECLDKMDTDPDEYSTWDEVKLRLQQNAQR